MYTKLTTLLVLAAFSVCPATAAVKKKLHKPVPRSIHRALRPAYLHSLIPVASRNEPGRSLHPVAGKKLARMSAAPEKKVGPLKNLPIETVGGPEDIGKSRPNEWSGLQTTIPAAVPGRTQGVTITHF